jgi:hypothetical protein
LEFRGRTGLTFDGNGSTFQSMKAMTSGSSTDDQRAMWRVIGSKSMAFTNMKVVGAYANGGTFDSTLQHAHGFDIRGTSVDIGSVAVSKVAGDCFYLGLGYDGTTRSTGRVHGSSCTSTGRNGVALTATNGVTVDGNTFGTIGFTAVDLEPNTGTYTSTSGWGTSNSTVTGNTIGTAKLYAFAVVEAAPNVNAAFTSNSVTGAYGLRVGVVAGGANVRPSGITISNNTATKATWSPAMEIANVDGLKVNGNTVPMSNGAMATVDNSCTVDVSGNTYTGGTSQVKITNPAC